MPNISRSKDNKTMKLGQLIEYRMSNIFLEKSCTKYGWEASSRHFYKKLSISMDQQSEMLHSLCLFGPSGGLSKYILKLKY